MMNGNTDKQADAALRLLTARLDELCDRAMRGRFCHTDFMTPRERHYAQAHLRRIGQLARARFHGGFDGAERTCLLLFPDYVVEAYGEGGFADAPLADLLMLAGEDDPVTALSVRAGGYRSLSHRDYLGSLLSLGIERDVLGDIVLDGNDATLLCLARIRSFLLMNVERIGGDGVRVKEITLPPDFDGGRRTMPVSDTVASARLDCVVAALANLSREGAQEVIRDGLVELDYECEERPDHLLHPPCTLSVRGVGKFNVLSLDTLTRKGRIRLLAEKYV